jgi:hypothetical protein
MRDLMDLIFRRELIEEGITLEEEAKTLIMLCGSNLIIMLSKQ